MSKKFPIKEIAFTIFLFASFLSYLTFTSQVNAAFIVQPPGPVYNNSDFVTLTINATDKDTFATGVTYFYSAVDSFIPSGTAVRCNNSGNVKVTDPKTIVIKVDLKSIRDNFASCRDLTGTWNFSLWFNDKNKPTAQGSFLIEQAGGGIPDIVPKQKLIRATDKVMMTLVGVNTQNGYSVWWDGDPNNVRWEVKQPDMYRLMNVNGTLDFDLGLGANPDRVKKPGPQKICMVVGNYGLNDGLACVHSTTVEFSENPPPAPTGPTCTITPEESPTKPTTSDTIRLIATSLKQNTVFVANLTGSVNKSVTVNSGIRDVNYFEFGQLPAGNYTAKMSVDSLGGDPTTPICSPVTFSVKSGTGQNGSGTGQNGCGSNCTSAGGIFCDPKNNGTITGNPNSGGGLTAIGCVPTEPVELIKGLMKFASQIGGGIALLLMAFGALGMLTSAGNPEGIKAGQERFRDAAIGLLFIIFSVLLLQIIGYDILQLPGFSR
ncbi:MAG: pilin [bacterium]|nr:pilin [bacterium]